MKNLFSEIEKEPKSLTNSVVRIERIRPASACEWDSIWKDCEYSTYFHSREWAEIWSCCTEGKMSLAPFIVVFSDGKKSLLPFSCLTKSGVIPILLGTNRQYISSPECTYGGWISPDNLQQDHGILLANLIKNKFSNIVWRVNPYDKVALQVNSNNSPDQTHVIKIEDFSKISRNMSKGHRTAVKQAIRSGVSIRLANSPKDWKDYYATYENSVDRWGQRLRGVQYSWNLFYEILRRNSPNVELWLAIHENKVISGALCFHSKRHFVYWHGASLESCFNLRPVNLLLYEIIRNVCERGFTWFDFNPSGGLQGVRAFKERFGAQSMNAPVVVLKTDNLCLFAIEKVNPLIVGIKKISRIDSTILH